MLQGHDLISAVNLSTGPLATLLETIVYGVSYMFEMNSRLCLGWA